MTSLAASARLRLRWTVALMILVSVTVQPSRDQEKKTFDISLPGDKYIVTYDPSRVAEADLRRWIQLSPEVSSANLYRVPESIDVCIEADPAYNDCPHNKPGTKTFVQNAETNLRRIRDRIEFLSTSQYPAELQPIAAYLKTVQQFALWRETAKLDFVRTRKITSLEGSYEGIEPAQKCTAELKAIQRAPSFTKSLKIVQHDWANCVLNLQLKRSGDYPVGEWNRFLAKYGIEEKVLTDDE